MSEEKKAKIAVIGGGVVGLGLVLSLRLRGIACDAYEAVPEVKELGVGITLRSHALRGLAALGSSLSLIAPVLTCINDEFSLYP